MGWQPESGAFRCSPELLQCLRQAAAAARIRGHCMRSDRLWVEMLVLLGGASPTAYGLRTNLTALLQHHESSSVLPRWVLFSFELNKRLCAMDDQASAASKLSP